MFVTCSELTYTFRPVWQLSSASNCTSYQSRRLSIRYRPAVNNNNNNNRDHRPPLEDLDIPTPAAFEATALYPSQTGLPSSSTSGAGSAATKLKFVHTLNATGAAIPRLIVALVENGAVISKEDGGKVERMRLPVVLKDFWLGPSDPLIEWVEKGQALRKEDEEL